MSNRLVVLLLAIGSFVTGTGELIIAGIMDWIASDLRVSVALAGQLVTVFSLSFAIGTPIVIALTTRINRKALLLITLACSFIGCIAAVLADSYAVMVLSRAVLGVCSGVFNVVAFSLAASLVASDKRGSAISSIQVGSSASLVVGVPLGVVIAGHFGWHAIFGVLAAATVIILLVILRVLPGIPGQAAALENAMNSMKKPRVIAALLINLLNVVGYSVCYTYITPFLQSMAHFTHASISVVLLLMGICGIIGSRIGGYATDKYGVPRTLLTLLAVHAASLLLSPAAGAVGGRRLCDGRRMGNIRMGHRSNLDLLFDFACARIGGNGHQPQYVGAPHRYRFRRGRRRDGRQPLVRQSGRVDRRVRCYRRAACGGMFFGVRAKQGTAKKLKALM
ncbi:MFS transporter [Paenibacillus sp. P25]|nr:MFS transporter [Paenibacillus sp. P25]